MITKGYIVSRIKDTNKFLVRIPIFATASSTAQISKDDYTEATLSYQPGNLESYKEGDVVFIGFENNEYSHPVILGKLYLGLDVNKVDGGFINVDSLKVTSKVNLPDNTSFGDINVSDLKMMQGKIQLLEDKVEYALEIIKNLKTKN